MYNLWHYNVLLATADVSTVRWIYNRIEGEFPEKRLNVIICSANYDRQFFLPVQIIDLETQLQTKQKHNLWMDE